MGIAIAHLAGDAPAVRCRICRREAPRGAKLCTECAAAVKRARHVPMVTSQFLPLTTSQHVGSASAPRVRTRGSRSTAKLRSWLPTRPGGWGVLAAFAIFGALVCATGYFAILEIDETLAPPGMASNLTLSPESTAAPLSAPPAGSAETWMFAKPADSDAGSPPPDLAAIPEPPVVVLPVPKPAARKPTPDPRITKVSATTPDWRAANRSDEADAVSRSMNEANAIQVAASAVGPMAPEGSVPSRWDALNAAVSRCSREGFIAGIVCSERARMQYCEGYWGAVPQCRGASSPDASR